MLSLWLCYFGNPASFYSRKAYVAWKKRFQLLLPNISNKPVVKNKSFEVQHKKPFKKCLKKFKIPNKVSISLYKFERICNKHNCASQCGINVLLQKRPFSYKQETSRLRKAKNFFVTLLPNKLLKKLEARFKVKSSTPVINCLTTNTSNSRNLLEHQHVLDFPNYFSKDATFNSATNLFQFKSNSFVIRKKSNKLQSSANAISFSNQTPVEPNFISSKKNIENSKSLPSSKSKKVPNDGEISHKSGAIVQRSQYENLASSLSSQKDAQLKEEKSVFSSLWTYVEIPVNSFFSFLSRSNFGEKENSSSNASSFHGNSDDKHIQVNETSEEMQQEQQLPQITSLLEMLYQYIPYVRSSTNMESEVNSGLKLDDAVRLKVS